MKSFVDGHAVTKSRVEKSILEHGHDDPPYVPLVEWIGTGDGDEKAATICVWPFDKRCWLPRTHFVLLVNDKRDVLAMTWRALEHRAPELLSQVPELYPPHWAVGPFPDESTFSAWKASNGEVATEVTRAFSAVPKAGDVGGDVAWHRAMAVVPRSRDPLGHRRPVRPVAHALIPTDGTRISATGPLGRRRSDLE